MSKLGGDNDEVCVGETAGGVKGQGSLDDEPSPPISEVVVGVFSTFTKSGIS